MRPKLTCLTLVLSTLVAFPALAEDKLYDDLKRVPELNAETPSEKTESYKVYKKSEEDRARLTDPSLSPRLTPGYRTAPASKSPAAKIYGRDRLGSFGARSTRSCC